MGSSPPPNGACIPNNNPAMSAANVAVSAAGGNGVLTAPVGTAAAPGTSQFSLCWNEYEHSVLTAFASLRDQEDFIDVTLSTEGSQFGAHKMLLSACSPFFRQLLKDNPCQHPIIILRDTAPKDLKAILHFMYHGEVSVDEKNLDSFLKAAASLKIRGLTDDSNAQQQQPSTSGAHQLLLRSPAAAASTGATTTSPSKTTTTATLLLQQATTSSGGRKRKNQSTVVLPTSPAKVPQMEEIKTELVSAMDASGSFPAAGAPVQTAEEAAAAQNNANAAAAAAYNLNLVYGGEQTVTTENFEDETSIGHSAILTTGIDTDPQNSTEQPLALISPLNRAMIQAHQQGRRPTDGGPNICSECGKGFKSKNALLDHEHVHKGATTCPFCGRICSTKGNLKQHLVKKHKFTS